MVEATAQNIEIILAELRKGRQIRIGGSRCHNYYGYKDGSWITGSFDEGYFEDRSCTRAEMVQHIQRHFSNFKGLLKIPHQRAIQDALHADDKQLALKHLLAWENIQDSLAEAPVLRAYLQWPDVLPGDDVQALIQEKIRSFTAYHVLMTHLFFKRTVENGVLGLKYLDTLIQIVGEVPRWRELRATFREMSADIEGAIEDLQYTLDTLSPEFYYQEDNVKQRIKRLQGMLKK